MKPHSYAVVLGTTAISLQLPAMGSLEIIPGGTVTVNATLGDGSDVLPLLNGTSYVTPTGIDVDAMRLQLSAASATTANVIAWF